MPKLRNKIQLITYPDSLGENLKDLKRVLDKYFKEAIFGLHILPFFPSNGDRGFSTLDNKKVAKRFGDWKDIAELGKKYDVAADLLLNHVSDKSRYFKDFLKNGEKSDYADYFITSEKFSKRINQRPGWLGEIIFILGKIANWLRRTDFIFHHRGVNRFTLKKVYRPRPGSPLVKFKLKDGTIKNVWCTFSRCQIDLDVESPGVKKLFGEILDIFAENGIKMVRFDAIGYVIKKRGTRSFMIPQTYRFAQWISKLAHERGLVSLPEVHYYYKYQLKLLRTPGVDYVYDFCLPLLTLYTLYTGSTEKLKNWIKIRPKNQVTTLDTHDGIPIINLKGLMTDEEIKFTASLISLHGGKGSHRTVDGNPKNLELYQMNCTYYSALGENDNAYITARVIQFFIPGVPQIYYVGLLAGGNDTIKMNRTKIPRNINRHNYTLDEIKEETKKEIVRRLKDLMKFRNHYPAFDGKFKMSDGAEEGILLLRWDDGEYYCEAEVNTKTYISKIKYLEIDSKKENIYIV